MPPFIWFRKHFFFFPPIVHFQLWKSIKILFKCQCRRSIFILVIFSLLIFLAESEDWTSLKERDAEAEPLNIWRAIKPGAHDNVVFHGNATAILSWFLSLLIWWKISLLLCLGGFNWMCSYEAEDIGNARTPYWGFPILDFLLKDYWKTEVSLCSG